MATKQITAEQLIEGFQKALDDNWGYIWGTWGKRWTQADQKQLEKTTDKDRAMSRKYGSKWIGHIVADCSGLFRRVYYNLGLEINHSVKWIWLGHLKKKGRLTNGHRDDGIILKPGTPLFTGDTYETHPHIGLYIGDGWIIEAKSSEAGIVKTPISDTRFKWWGELKEVVYMPDKPDDTPVRPTLRKGSKGEYVKILQTKLNEKGFDLTVDGNFGSGTEAAVKKFQKQNGLKEDGIVGQTTWSKLDGSAPVTYTVTITGLSKDKADEIVAKYGGKIT